jgi:hypothetical protein
MFGIPRLVGPEEIAEPEVYEADRGGSSSVAKGPGKAGGGHSLKIATAQRGAKIPGCAHPRERGSSKGPRLIQGTEAYPRDRGGLAQGSDVAGSDVAGSEVAGSDVAGSEVAGSEVAGSEVAGPY